MYASSLAEFVRAVVFVTTILSTYSSFTSTDLEVDASSNLAVIVYVPAVKFAVAVNVASVFASFHVIFPSTAAESPVLFTVITVFSSTGAANLATKVAAEVAVKSVMFRVEASLTVISL